VVWGVSIVVALLATILVWFTTGVPKPSLLVAFFSILFTTVLLLSLIHRIFIRPDLEKVNRTVKQMEGKSVFDHSQSSRYSFGAIKEIDERIREISERKIDEIADLRKMEDFRKDFLANVSHELKTPLFAAQGFVHTLLDGAVKDKNVRTRFLKKAARSLDALDILVQDLLTLSQMEIGEIKMHFEYFDIYKLVEEVAEQLDEPSIKRNITLKLEAKRGQFIVYADYVRIQQVLSNLVQNGIKYNKEGGSVIVQLHEFKNWVSVDVTDNGDGIPEEHLDKIFERFYRVDKSRSRKWGGTGLGLSIVKHVLEGHHTKIKVNSKVGKGSTFSFKLINNRDKVPNPLP